MSPVTDDEDVSPVTDGEDLVEDLNLLMGLPRLPTDKPPKSLLKLQSNGDNTAIAIYEVVPIHKQVAVRREAAVGAEIIGMKVPGESIEVFDFDGRWVQVHHMAEGGKVKGWMATNLKEHGDLLRPLAGVSLGEDMLISAARRDAHVDLRRLVREGEDPNRTDALGETPLFEAAASGSLRAVGMLLHLKADPCHRCSNGSQAVDFASCKLTRELLAATLGRETDMNLVSKAIEVLPLGLQRETRNLLKNVREDAEGQLVDVDASSPGKKGAFSSSLAAAVAPHAQSGTDAKSPPPQQPQRRCGAFSTQAAQAAKAEEEFAEEAQGWIAEAKAAKPQLPHADLDGDAAILQKAIRSVTEPQPSGTGAAPLLYEVVHKPLVAVRAEPLFDAPVLGGKRYAEVVEALEVHAGEGSNWIKVEHKTLSGFIKGWMALSTPSIGPLLKPVADGAG